ncbi:MAG: hypothetical protein ACE37N_09600 [Pseudohongiellaceae bacterium]
MNYPFQKFDFALIPGFQYGGMEHVGAIQYRADSIFWTSLHPEPAAQSRQPDRPRDCAHVVRRPGHHGVVQ